MFPKTGTSNCEVEIRNKLTELVLLRRFPKFQKQEKNKLSLKYLLHLPLIFEINFWYPVAANKETSNSYFSQIWPEITNHRREF